MIISHKFRFIFFAVPRTATHTLRFIIRKQLDPADWEQVWLHHKSFIPIPEIAKIRHGHISVATAKKNLNSDIWHNYYKFAIVRNPYDRFISSVYFKKQRTIGQVENPLEYMKTLLEDPLLKTDMLFCPQTDYLLNDNDKIELDYIGRLEHLQDSFDEVCKQTGLHPEILDRRNSSDHLPYREHYDERLYSLVSDFYKKDLQLLNYPSGNYQSFINS